LQTVQEHNEVTLKRVNRCQFCGKTFVRKSWFLRHACAKKKKFSDSNDVVVQHAYRVYTYWMMKLGLSKKGKEQTFDKFLKSPRKNAFIKLVEFSHANDITSLYTYVDWLINNKIPESRWYDDSGIAVDRFKQYSLEYEDPIDQAFATKKYIERWILEKPNERTAEVFFSKLTAGAILTMVRQGMIKPWPLLAYEPISSKWLSDEKYNADVFYRISDIINCDYWADKISADIDSVEAVVEIMDQLWEYQT
jgi:hypothetical protein